MDTNALKKFAQAARTQLIDQVTSKLAVVLDPASAARREHPEAMKALDGAIADQGKAQVIEQVAYTWFNRFAALRFMDANGYTLPRVVSPADGATRPENLAEAMAGNLPDKAPPAIAALLDGRVPSSDPQGEAYRLLLVHACNAWHKPMPFLFEKFDDYSELLMPDDLLSPASILARLRDVLSEEVCADVEVIGWLYQFYISEKKQQVFDGLKKNQKITAENIPAATQLFTPHWIVRYLVENSLGRLWLLNRPASKLAERMDYYIAPEEPETDFLKISKPEEIKVCDPACGSGHMLTYAFDLLHAIYEEEGYEPEGIPELILAHNLTGVEIDDRAGALAAFALAMKAAARLGRRRFLRMEAKPGICVLQNVTFTPAELRDVATVVGRDLFTDELRETLRQFEQAKSFGSLIVPKLRDPTEALRVVQTRDFGSDLLLKEVHARVMAVLRMAEALSPKYHVVVANPPYMGSKGMNEATSNWIKEHYPDGKLDLFAAFIDRALVLSGRNAFSALVTMEGWMFLSSFEALRTKVLSLANLQSLVHMPYLGKGGTSMGISFGTSAFILEKNPKNQPKAEFTCVRYFETDENGVPFSFPVQNERRRSVSGAMLMKIPGNPISYWASEPAYVAFSHGSISSQGDTRRGLQTGDKDRFIRSWHEVSARAVDWESETREQALSSDRKWFRFNNGGSFRKWYGNLDLVVEWESSGSTIKSSGKAIIPSEHTYFLSGVCWGRVTSGIESFRLHPAGVLPGDLSPCFFSDLTDVALYYLNSKPAIYFKDLVNPTLANQVGDIARIPIMPTDVAHQLNNLRPLVNTHRADWDAFETSWDFTTLPLLSPDRRGETLAATFARLRVDWQRMTDETQRLEEENNRIFIDAYRLQGELTPEVPLEEITLTCNPAYRYGGKASPEELEERLRADTMAELLHYAVGCMFGRYSLDAPGLILANQGEGLEEYLKRVPNPTFEIDADNVIPVLDGEWFADDITGRFRKFLRVTFGEAKFQETLAFIETALGKDIRKWFTKDFFDYHVRRFKKRPIYWMFSSPKGSFNALIYMHSYRPDTVSIMLNDYLREFISKLQAERARLEKLSDDPAASPAQRTRALKDVATVIKQLAELEEWEREVVFPLAQAKIEIDLDDGVKRNYPKFGAALKPIKGLETADE
jgi:hypothetical protein